jgi:predicted metal-dependent hydrolase
VGEKARPTRARRARPRPAETLGKLRIVQAAPTLVDYVLAHEVVHVVHADHGAGFGRRLGRIMPDYEERREELRRIGATFEW